MKQERALLGFAFREGADRGLPRLDVTSQGLRHERTRGLSPLAPVESPLPPAVLSLGPPGTGFCSLAVTRACHTLSCLGNLISTHEFTATRT